MMRRHLQIVLISVSTITTLKAPFASGYGNVPSPRKRLVRPVETSGCALRMSLVIDEAKGGTIMKGNVDTSAVPLSSLPLPPGPKRAGPLRVLRDSFSYLWDPDRFIRTRSERHGPVFRSHIFFRPTVVVGGQTAVADFVAKERTNGLFDHGLPPTFLELYTEYGALAMSPNEERHKNLRNLFNDLIGPKAINEYSPFIEQSTEKYVDDLVLRVKENPQEPIYLVPEFCELCLQIYSQLFSGKGLTDEQIVLFNEYNAGLLSPSRRTKSWKKAEGARDILTKEMTNRFRDFREQSTPDPAKTGFRFLSACSQKLNDGTMSEEALTTQMMLFIWAGYIETAQLMVKSIIMLPEADEDGEKRKFIIDNILAETRKSSGDPEFFTEGVVREVLRLNPPAGGGFRLSLEEMEIDGFRIPAGTFVTADPRIGNNDPDLFAEAATFAPERWLPESGLPTGAPSTCPFQGTARTLGLGSWFPGGIGGHQCPGIPLAEKVTKAFLPKFLRSFKSWKKQGGLTKNGEVKYVMIPIKIPVDKFGLVLDVKD